jgi:hypothetical protein
MRQNKHPGVRLTVPCGQYELELVMARLQEKKDDCDKAFILLQAMRQQQRPGVSLTTPCGLHELDLTVVRLQQRTGDYDKAGILLQAARQERCPGVSLTTLCGQYDLDLAMAKLQEETGSYDNAYALLRALRQQQRPGVSLTVPCGRSELNLAMLLLLEKAGKHALFEILVSACCSAYPYQLEYRRTYLSNLCRRKLWDRFDEETKEVGTIKHAGIQLVISIRFFQEALDHFNKNEKKKGFSFCRKALAVVERAIAMCPADASLFSQKAHCLRMLGQAPEVWIPLFKQADALNPARIRQEKLDSWREDEGRALEILTGRCWQ